MERNELLKLSRHTAEQWLSSKIDDNTRKEIEQMLAGDENLLIDSFYTHLEFGTGGLRGIMGAGTNWNEYLHTWNGYPGLGKLS